MAQNPYADIFGRLIEYSFQRKLWERRMEEERKQQEEAFKRHSMQNLGSQLMQEAGKLSSIPPDLIGLPAKMPGVEFKTDPEKQQELEELQRRATEVGAKLIQGEPQPDAAPILAQLRSAFAPSLEQKEGKSYLQYGGTTVIIPGDSEQAAEAAVRVKKILEEAEARNKATAENIAFQNQITGLLGGLPENEERKNSLISAFKTFSSVANLYPDPTGRAAAVLTTAQTQIAEIENGPNKDDPHVQKYVDYLKKQAAAAERVVKMYEKGDSAAGRKQKIEEMAYAAAYRLSKLVLPAYKPEDVNKAKYPNFVRGVFDLVYNSPEGQELAKRYGDTVMGRALQIVLRNYYGIDADPRMAFALPGVD